MAALGADAVARQLRAPPGSARAATLHQAKLLTDDEIGALEDCVADYIDCRSSLNPAAAEIGVAAEKVKKMVGLSEGIAKDGMLARQLRRKLAAGQ